MAGLVGLPVRHATLVGGAHCHSRCGEPKEASLKIHASLFILVVRCEILPGQDYTVPPAPKCLTRGRFLPNDPSYQDVQWQPLLQTMAYAWVLQYWVEKTRLPALLDYHPLAMSVVQLMQHVRGHVTLDKWDIFWNLGRITLETVSQGTVIPPRGLHPSLLMLETWNQTLLKPGGTWHCPLIIQTSTQGGDPTSWTHCLAYQGWCWAYSTWPCRHSTGERCHGPFNQTWHGNPKGLADWLSH